MNNQNPEDNAVALRKRLKQARADMSDPDRQRGALLMRARLFTWLNLVREQAMRNGSQPPQVVAAFWPMPSEPDLRPLLEQWTQAGVTVALPVVEHRAAPLQFYRWAPDAAMRSGLYGIAEPAGGEPLEPDVVLVPTLGYTGLCDRLGYGGGYYDRTLAAMKAAGRAYTAIGIAWTSGRLDDSYAPAGHDVRLDAVLTPRGWVPHAPGGDDTAPAAPLFRTQL